MRDKNTFTMSAVESIGWPKSFPDLERLDKLLRCGICYEFVKVALITPCSHNFCSLCIRKYMQYKTSCPACLSITADIHLKKNKVLDEMVVIMERLKDPLCEALSEYESIKQHPTSHQLSNSIMEEGSKSGESSTRQSEFQPSNTDTFTNTSVLRSPIMSSKPQYSQGNFKPSEISDIETSKQSLESESKVLEEENNTMEYFDNYMPASPSFPLPPESNKSQEFSGSSSLQSSNMFDQKHKPEIQAGSSSCQTSPKKPVRTIAQYLMSPSKKSQFAVRTVQCPICNVDIPERNINLHVDACLKNDKLAPKQSYRSEDKARRPLAKPVYKLMNDKDLKKRLTEYKLSTQGDRKTLEKRHQRFVVLYNSECDSENPRPVSELVKQLEREEKEESRSSSKTLLSQQVDRKSDPKDIERAHQKYLKENKSSFDSLLADLKQRQLKAKSAIPSTSTSAPSSSTSSSASVSTSSVSNATPVSEPSCSQQQTSLIAMTASASKPSTNIVSSATPSRSRSPSLLPQISPETPTLFPLTLVKSPVIGRKRLFDSQGAKPGSSSVVDVVASRVVDDDVLNSPIAIIDISDDSNSTVFSEGDLAQIDAVISQHNASLIQPQVEEENSGDVWNIQTNTTKPEQTGNNEGDSSDSEGMFQLPRRKPVPLPPSPVFPERQTRAKKRSAGETMNKEPRRSSRKKPRS